MGSSVSLIRSMSVWVRPRPTRLCAAESYRIENRHLAGWPTCWRALATVILDRTPFWVHGRDSIRVEVAPQSALNARMPAWAFSSEKSTRFMESRRSVLVDNGALNHMSGCALAGGVPMAGIAGFEEEGSANVTAEFSKDSEW